MPSKGVKTTEFWMFVATGLVLILNGTSYVNIPWDQYTVWMAANGLYVAGRTAEKVAAKRADKKEPSHA